MNVIPANLNIETANVICIIDKLKWIEIEIVIVVLIHKHFWCTNQKTGNQYWKSFKFSDKFSFQLKLTWEFTFLMLYRFGFIHYFTKIQSWSSLNRKSIDDVFLKIHNASMDIFDTIGFPLYVNIGWIIKKKNLKFRFESMMYIYRFWYFEIKEGIILKISLNLMTFLQTLVSPLYLV